MAPTETLKDNGLARYWPFGAAGLSGPLFAVFLNRWTPFYIAIGVSSFVCFAGAVRLFQRGSGRSLTASVVSGLAAGVVSGLLAYLFS